MASDRGEHVGIDVAGPDPTTTSFSSRSYELAVRCALDELHLRLRQRAEVEAMDLRIEVLRLERLVHAREHRRQLRSRRARG